MNSINRLSIIFLLIAVGRSTVFGTHGETYMDIFLAIKTPSREAIQNLSKDASENPFGFVMSWILNYVTLIKTEDVPESTVCITVEDVARGGRWMQMLNASVFNSSTFSTFATDRIYDLFNRSKAGVFDDHPVSDDEANCRSGSRDDAAKVSFQVVLGRHWLVGDYKTQAMDIFEKAPDTSAVVVVKYFYDEPRSDQIVFILDRHTQTNKSWLGVGSANESSAYAWELTKMLGQLQNSTVSTLSSIQEIATSTPTDESILNETLTAKPSSRTLRVIGEALATIGGIAVIATTAFLFIYFCELKPKADEETGDVTKTSSRRKKKKNFVASHQYVALSLPPG